MHNTSTGHLAATLKKQKSQLQKILCLAGLIIALLMAGIGVMMFVMMAAMTASPNAPSGRIRRRAQEQR